MARKGAPDNPDDHEHTHYLGPWIGVLIFGLMASIGMAGSFVYSDDIDSLEDRLNSQEERLCAVADDEAACLAELLEERR